MTNFTTTAQSLVDSDADVRSCVRSAAGQRGATMPIVVVPGSSRPSLEGEPGYHTTPSGKTRVHHPGAYKWRTLYHHSTQRVEVGAEWVRRHCPVPFREAARG
jgi:hypothetical protein